MIFLIGGSGFVGSGYARMLAATGREFVVITRENYDQYRGQHCDVLINANGNSKKFLAKEAPIEEFDASVRSVRRSLVDFHYDRYVFLSSVDVYPDCSTPESTAEESLPDPEQQSPYGFHKYLAEQCVRHVAKDWLIIRMGGFVGPGMRKNPIYDILSGGPLWLDPQSELQFLHTDRAAAMILSLVDRRHTHEVINACGRGLVKLQDVIEATGRPVPVKPGSPRVHYEVNIEKLSALCTVPETRSAVLDFVHETLQSGGSLP